MNVSRRRTYPLEGGALHSEDEALMLLDHTALIDVLPVKLDARLPSGAPEFLTEEYFVAEIFAVRALMQVRSDAG